MNIFFVMGVLWGLEGVASATDIECADGAVITSCGDGTINLSCPGSGSCECPTLMILTSSCTINGPSSGTAVLTPFVDSSNLITVAPTSATPLDLYIKDMSIVCGDAFAVDAYINSGFSASITLENISATCARDEASSLVHLAGAAGATGLSVTVLGSELSSWRSGGYNPTGGGGSDSGGGLFYVEYGTVTVSDSVISDPNTSAGDGHLAYLDGVSSTLTLSDNLITLSNTKGNSNAALLVLKNGAQTVWADNAIQVQAGAERLLRLEGGALATLTQLAILAEDGADLLNIAELDGDSSLSLGNSLIFGGPKSGLSTLFEVLDSSSTLSAQYNTIVGGEGAVVASSDAEITLTGNVFVGMKDPLNGVSLTGSSGNWTDGESQTSEDVLKPAELQLATLDALSPYIEDLDGQSVCHPLGSVCLEDLDLWPKPCSPLLDGDTVQAGFLHEADGDSAWWTSTFDFNAQVLSTYYVPPTGSSWYCEVTEDDSGLYDYKPCWTPIDGACRLPSDGDQSCQLVSKLPSDQTECTHDTGGSDSPSDRDSPPEDSDSPELYQPGDCTSFERTTPVGALLLLGFLATRARRRGPTP